MAKDKPETPPIPEFKRGRKELAESKHRDAIERGKNRGRKGAATMKKKVAEGAPPINSKLTPAVAAKIAALFAEGLHGEVVAAQVGISRGTLRAWLQRGSEQEDQYVRIEENGEKLYKSNIQKEYKLLVAIRKAQAEYEQALVGTISKASIKEGDWRAAHQLLQLRFPKRWRPQTETTTNLTLQAQVQHVVVAPGESTPEEWVKQITAASPKIIDVDDNGDV